MTGAGRGIGRGTAEQLVRRGYAVVVTDIDADAARRAAADVGAVAGLGQDVREEASHARVAEEAKQYGELAVWVNNAGVGYDGTLSEVTSEQVEALVDINLKGVLWGMRAALAAFGPAGGDVVNIASASGLGPVPGLAVYAATKAAVVSVTMSASVEAPHAVRVHTLPRRRRHRDGRGDATRRPGQGHRALLRSAAHRRRGRRRGSVAGRQPPRHLPTLPAWRGGMVRLGALVPSQSRGAFRLFELVGRRVMDRIG